MNRKLLILFFLSYMEFSTSEPICEKDFRTITCKGVTQSFPWNLEYGHLMELVCAHCDITMLTNSSFPFDKQISIYSLNISNSKLEVIGSHTFANFKLFGGVKYIFFENNKISNISQNAFDNLYEITEIKLTHNNIFDLSQGFTNHMHVKKLSLDHNKIVEIPNDIFEWAYNIEHLILSHNKIRIINLDSFKGLYDTKSLDLNDNRICSIPTGALSRLKSLETLNLANNKLSKIFPGTFSGLRNLKSLILANNTLKSFEGHELLPLNILTKLNIAGNKINKIDPHDIFSFSPSIKEISLENNPFRCSMVVDLIKYFKEKQIKVYIENGVYNLQNIHGIACIKGELDSKQSFMTQVQEETSKVERC